MLPEADLVSVGESCVEKGLFGNEVIASDRKVRESLRKDVLLNTSTSTVEGISNRMLYNAKRASELNCPATNEQECGLELSEEEVVGKPREQLTEAVLKRFTEEMEKLHPETAHRSGMEDPGRIAMPDYNSEFI